MKRCKKLKSDLKSLGSGYPGTVKMLNSYFFLLSFLDLSCAAVYNTVASCKKERGRGVKL
jgi:hypothetical protein